MIMPLRIKSFTFLTGHKNCIPKVGPITKYHSKYNITKLESYWPARRNLIFMKTYLTLLCHISTETTV